MARDWKSTYSEPVDAAQHTVAFAQTAIAGRTLVAFASAPASIALPDGWVEHQNSVVDVGLSLATKTAAGGETSLTWSRDAGQSTAPRALAGWVESRDDLGALEESGAAPVIVGGGAFLEVVVTTPVDGCRVYVALSHANPLNTVPPSWPSPLQQDDLLTADSPAFEDVRLIVASGVYPQAGVHTVRVDGLIQSQQYQVVTAAFAPAGGGTPPPAAVTAVEAENRIGGVGKATWDVDAAFQGGHPTIQGFATATHIARGATLDLKVHSPAAAWSGKVYRLGWYGGLGARELGSVSGPQTTQPNGTTDGTTGMVSCANWTINGSWAVPADAPAGVYVIRIGRVGNLALNSHIGPFVVTDPARKAAIAVKLSDSTWQAYNHAGADPSDPFAGKSIYGVGTASAWTFNEGQRSRAVSYDRPLVTRLHLPQTSFFNAEYPLVRWLERLGYDVDYLSCAQVDADPSLLLGRKAVISSGHDEYWSAGMRDAFVAARDHATTRSHLVFLSGNEAFWRIRWDSGRRTYACWKDTLDGALNASGAYSGTWQDTRSFNTDRRPAALLNGQRFRLNGISSYPMAVPAALAASPLWRSTTVAQLGAGQTWTSPTGIVGFEADEPADVHQTEKPAGLIRMSQVAHQVTAMLSDDNGAVYSGSGTYVHAMTAFRSPISGALVFAAGTVQYAWGLDDVHDRHPGGSLVSPALQQALTNLLADLGAVPPAYPFPGDLLRPTPVALSTYGLPDPVGPNPDPDPDPTPIPGAYATIAQLHAELGSTPANARQLLIRASRAVDRALLTSVYNPADTAVIAALRAATLEQVLGTLEGGDKTGLGVASISGGFSIGRLTVQKSAASGSAPTTGGLVDQAFAILQAAGLTGHAPWTC